MIVVAAVISPIGIILGWLLSDLGNLMTGVFMSFSAGTFLYISTIEVIVEEFNSDY